MASDGHAPTNGAVAIATIALGRGKCPRCRKTAPSLEETPDLEPAGSSSMVCPVCDWSIPVGWIA